MANRCAYRKTPNKMFEQTRQTQFRPSEHPEKTSNNKKLLHIIQKNGFRLLLSTAVKMVGAYMVCLIFKKVKKQKSHSSNHVMTDFLMRLSDYSTQSIKPWASARKYCHDNAKCDYCSQSTRLRHFPTSRMKSSSCSRVEYT